MSTRNYVEDLEYLDAKGLDTASPINLLQPGFVREAVNVNLGPTGGYIKRDGYTRQTLNNKVGDVQISDYILRAGLQYRNTNPFLTQQLQILLFGRNANNGVFGKVNLNNEFEGFKTYNTNTSAAEPLDLNQTNRPSFAQIGNSLFYFDGSGESETPFVYEANVNNYVRPLGIAAPVAAAGATKVAGSVLTDGEYIYCYMYVFVDSAGNEVAESSPAPLTNVTIDNANKAVNLTFSAFPNYLERAANDLSHLSVFIKLYRTVVNGSILFLVDSRVPVTGTYSDVIPDAGLQAEQMAFDNTRITDYEGYDEARFPVVARNRLLVFHPTQNKGRFSKIGPNGPLPESFPVQNEFSVEGKFGASDAVVGAGQLKGIPIIFKERSIGRLEEVGIPDLGNNEDSVIYIYREISETTGGISHFAQTQVFDELLFLGRDNIYATNGETVRPIATTIQNLIRNIDFAGTRPSEFSAVNDTKNRRVYFQVYKNTASTRPDITLVGDYQQYPNFRWTTYEAGLVPADAPGIMAACFFQTEATLGAGGGLEIFFGDAVNPGRLHRMNSGRSDDTKDIRLKLVTRPYMFGQPMLKKLYKTAKIWAEAQDSSYQFQFSAIFNINETPVISTPFTVPGAGTTWDNYVWPYTQDELDEYAALQLRHPGIPNAPTADPGIDGLEWTGDRLNEYKYHVHRKAEMMQLVFTQNSKNAPLTLLGWGVAGSVFSGI